MPADETEVGVAEKTGTLGTLAGERAVGESGDTASAAIEREATEREATEREATEREADAGGGKRARGTQVFETNDGRCDEPGD